MKGHTLLKGWDKSEIVKLYWKYFKILSLKLLGGFQPNSWVDGIQIFTNKGPHPSSKGDDSKIIKIYGEYLKKFYFRTTGPVSSKLGIKHPWVKEIQNFFFQIKSHALLQVEIIANL